MKMWIGAILLGLAGFVIGGLMCRPDGQAEAAKMRADSLGSVVDSLDRLGVASATRITTLERNNRALEVTARSVSRRVDSIRALIPIDSAVPYTTHVAVVEGLDSIIDLTRAQRDSNAVIVYAVIAERDQWRHVAKGLQGELTAALKRANRRWFCVGGATTGVGYGGYVAGVGVTCGRRL